MNPIPYILSGLSKGLTWLGAPNMWLLALGGGVVLFYEGIFFANFWPVNAIPYAGPIIQGRVNRVAEDRIASANSKNLLERDRLRKEAAEAIRNKELENAIVRKALQNQQDTQAAALKRELDKVSGDETVVIEKIVEVPVEKFIMVPRPTPVETITKRTVIVSGGPKREPKVSPDAQTKCPTPRPRKVRVKIACPNPLTQRIPDDLLRTINQRGKN